MDKEAVDMFRMGRKVNKNQDQFLLNLKVSLQKNTILANASELKNSEVFKRVILSQDLSKEDRQECKKCCFQNKRSSLQMEEPKSRQHE